MKITIEASSLEEIRAALFNGTVGTNVTVTVDEEPKTKKPAPKPAPAPAPAPEPDPAPAKASEITFETVKEALMDLHHRTNTQIVKDILSHHGLTKFINPDDVPADKLEPIFKEVVNYATD